MNLTPENKVVLRAAGFTEREINLYKIKFYYLLNTFPKNPYNDILDQNRELLKRAKESEED